MEKKVVDQVVWKQGQGGEERLKVKWVIVQMYVYHTEEDGRDIYNTILFLTRPQIEPFIQYCVDQHHFIKKTKQSRVVSSGL